ncbi:glucokinase [Aquabacterium sp.]|uniref:glucokinase n=1 Tax=Aquabacterium sp. TaxID=1872578 RepID=UPI002C18E48E|nr:glucokinase [Aquabacterium sp.]HSW02946.1 glucokinase [Aquabacterium sp.]
MNSFDSPRLIADIGGTYARFALEQAPGRFEQAASLPCAEHVDLQAAVTAYLQTLSGPRPLHAAIAIANPVEGDQVRMTNSPWQFSIEQMRERLQLQTLVVVNDFTALAMAVPRLAAQDKRQVGGGQAREGSVVGVLGAGSGLGVSGLIPVDPGWVALGTEGGHSSFAPHDEREVAILRHAWRQFPHVSFERLLSGAGLELIHRALAEHAGAPDAPVLSAPEITRRGLEGSDALCAEAIEVFCALLGTAASNLAVSLGALGGVYIGGGIVPRLGAYFDRSSFRARFEDKGRFSHYLRHIPTYVITAGHATLTGASAILQAQLRARETAPAPALLSQIQRGLDSLSPAERRVADQVLAHPRSALNDPIADIAKAAGVSQPTVIRFCRSLGCEGLSDFKLRLASGLTGTVPVTHAQVTGEDSMVELGSKVLDNTASAILQLRDQLNRDTIDRTIEWLNVAERIQFHAVGHDGPAAMDAQFKFLRFGLSCQACTDAPLQLLAAGVLRPGDVVVIISSSGRIDELLQVTDIARARGAQVVAITGSQSPLAKKADIALIVDHPEDAATQLPMISRILHLLVIDILAVGVSMRREAGSTIGPAVDNAVQAALRLAGTPRGLPGVSASLPYARLTSHSRR